MKKVMTKFKTVTEGLAELHARMNADKTWQSWPEDFSTSYRFHIQAQMLLRNKANADATKHALWHDAHKTSAASSTFHALFWIKSFEHLAQVFDVPMSWLAVMRLTAHPNIVTGNKWRLKELTNVITSEGYCYDSLWASHLDGVEQGLIDNEEFPFQRTPDSVAISDAALAKSDLESFGRPTR